MFQRILVANRGEIALRVIRACRDLGRRGRRSSSTARPTAAPRTWSWPTRPSASAPPPAGESYLKTERDHRRRRGGRGRGHPPRATASCPRTPTFAEMCRDCNIEFIGPPHEAMNRLGNKNEAKQAGPAAAKVPLVPGSEGLITAEAEALRLAGQIGYPVLIKAAAGGGGRGMRVARSDDTLLIGLERRPARRPRPPSRTAASTSKSTSTGRGTSRSRSSATAHGNVVHLYERDCSLQRRHQKLVEESPAPNLPEKVRDEHLRSPPCDWPRRPATTRPGRASSCVDKDYNFYFIEVNARIQVEHPVTELVTGIDLDPRADPHRGRREAALHAGATSSTAGRPSSAGSTPRTRRTTSGRRPGVITRWQPPGGPGVRLDTHVVRRLPRAAELRLAGGEAAGPPADAGGGARRDAAGAARVHRRGDPDDDPDPPDDLQHARRSSKAGWTRRSSSGRSSAARPSRGSKEWNADDADSADQDGSDGRQA